MNKAKYISTNLGIWDNPYSNNPQIINTEYGAYIYEEMSKEIAFYRRLTMRDIKRLQLEDKYVFKKYKDMITL